MSIFAFAAVASVSTGTKKCVIRTAFQAEKTIFRIALCQAGIERPSYFGSEIQSSSEELNLDSAPHT